MTYRPLTDDILDSLARTGYVDRMLIEQARRANRLAEVVVSAQAAYLASDDWYSEELDEALAAYRGE